MLKINYLIHIIILMLVISCQQNDFNEERVIEIGKELTQTIYLESDTIKFSDIIMVGKGLKKKINELQMESSKFEFKVINGDLERPNGDGQADAVLIIKTNSEDIGIRLKYNRERDKYDILGWITLD